MDYFVIGRIKTEFLSLRRMLVSSHRYPPRMASSSSFSTTPAFKVLLVGDGGVGKTALAKRLRYGDFVNYYLPTLGVELIPLNFVTSSGPAVINVWDCAGRALLGGGRKGYYTGAHAAIVMFDLTNESTYSSIANLVNSIRESEGNIPIVVCGNKADSENRGYYPVPIGMPYYDISAKTMYNFENPFLHILRVLLGNPELRLESIRG